MKNVCNNYGTNIFELNFYYFQWFIVDFFGNSIEMKNSPFNLRSQKLDFESINQNYIK